MEVGELVKIVAAVSVVVVMAFVARRFQSVQLPPGAKAGEAGDTPSSAVAPRSRGGRRQP